MKRRDLLRWSIAGSVGMAFSKSFLPKAMAAVAVPGPSPYGPIAATPDANGLRLPAQFTSRVIAVTGSPVPNTSHVWHLAPDGGACFPRAGGGWFYASNSEVPLFGGAAVIEFDSAGNSVAARTILTGTTANCAGGPTPWGTWLSCEEYELGRVWECYLDGRPAQRRPDLGMFSHEAAAVDPVRGRVYMTEDQSDGRLYMHVPSSCPDLGSGQLYAARVSWDNSQRLGGSVRWYAVPDDLSARAWPMSTYTTAFNGGEGCWFDPTTGHIYFTTKGDNRVWSYNAGTGRIAVVYDAALQPAAPLRGVDNIVVGASGDIYVAEDGDDMQLCIITPGGAVATFMELEGHDGSEITGPAFTPDHSRLLFSSQRGTNGGGVGMTFEIRGPFRR